MHCRQRQRPDEPQRLRLVDVDAVGGRQAVLAAGAAENAAVDIAVRGDLPLQPGGDAVNLEPGSSKSARILWCARTYPGYLLPWPPRTPQASGLQRRHGRRLRATVRAEVVRLAQYKVVALIDDNDRRESVTLRLQISEPLQVLMDLEKTKRQIDQRSLIFLLRATFSDRLVQPGLIDVLRKVRFQAQQAGESEIGRGKSSLSKLARRRCGACIEADQAKQAQDRNGKGKRKHKGRPFTPSQRLPQGAVFHWQG